MSLERKDVRAYLDADLDAALTAICNVKGTTKADWIESVIAPVLREIVRENSELHDAFRRGGILRSDPELAPVAGQNRGKR